MKTGAIALILLLACTLGQHSTELGELAEEHDMATAISERDKRVEAAFNNLTIHTVDDLDAFYADDVSFEDPLGRIEGLGNLKTYYTQLYQNVQEIAFDFHRHVSEGDHHVAVWTLRMKAEKLNGGDEVVVEGTSVLRFDEHGLVAYHRDFFDLGQMVYQHVPVLRWFVKKVNQRLAHENDE